MAWETYRDLRAACEDVGVGPSVAGSLACALDLLGVSRLADMGRVGVDELTRLYGVGGRCAEVAPALGAREAPDD